MRQAADDHSDEDMGREGRAAGRPFDKSLSPKVMKAARDLVRRHGYADVTIAMIADKAGVGRQTVYRRWRSKADLVLDSYLESAEEAGVVAEGPVITRVETLLNQHFAKFEEDRPALRNLIASAQSDDAFRGRLEERFARSVDGALEAILRAAVDTGELQHELDLETMAEAIHGAIWYRLLLGRALDEQFVKRLTRTVVSGAVC